MEFIALFQSLLCCWFAIPGLRPGLPDCALAGLVWRGESFCGCPTTLWVRVECSNSFGGFPQVGSVVKKLGRPRFPHWGWPQCCSPARFYPRDAQILASRSATFEATAMGQ